MATDADQRAKLRRAGVALAFRGRHLLFLDILAVLASFVGSFALRFDAPSSAFAEYLTRFVWIAPLLVGIRAVTFVALGLYQRVWRYASVAELQALVVAVFVSSAIAYPIAYAVGVFDQELQGLPRSIPVIDTLLTLALVGGMRFSFLVLRLGRRGGGASTAQRTLVVGAGAAGVSVAKQVLDESSLSLQIVGFVDEKESKGHRLLGLPVLGAINELQALIHSHGIGTVLFALPGADGATLRRLVRIAEREGARSLTVPSISEVVTGQVTSALREIRVDDLLRRAPAKIDFDAVRESLHGKIVLITGAGGSIGSELARQIARFEPSRLYLLGRGENSVYEVMESLRSSSAAIVPIILDVRERAAIERVIRDAGPDVVFHAAAHKHVHFMEQYPEQAVSTNIFGTLNLLSACERSDVPRLVFVSTDKAVRPTSVMGATKRVGEILVRDSARRTGNRYVVVRFGNVLSSRGSVLPRFRRQLAEGGPLTVTHPEVLRYFMTLSEAVLLILQASVLGTGGETFVLDMGKPVRIDDLARDLIEMNGLVPGKDIQITYTGLQRGEKMTEELFFPDERPSRTEHESIWMAQGPLDAPISTAAIASADLADLHGSEDVRRGLMRLLPEYRPELQPAEDTPQHL
jgi:FlaA1/EpsC-like NDP-sugar epimerase